MKTDIFILTVNNVNFSAELGEYTYFDLEEAENGWFIKSTNAQYSGKPQYLEFYGGYFTCYGMNSGNSVSTPSSSTRPAHLTPLMTPCG